MQHEESELKREAAERALAEKEKEFESFKMSVHEERSRRDTTEALLREQVS